MLDKPVVGALSAESYAYGIENGHPPIAKNTLCIDFDGTLYPWADDSVPHLGAVKVMRDLKARGYRLIIFTSRLSPRWIKSEKTSLRTQYLHVATLLLRDGIPYDGITAEKIPALIYIDDRALRFENNWEEISERVRDIAGS